MSTEPASASQALPDSREVPSAPTVDVVALANLKAAARRWHAARQPVEEGSRYEAAREWQAAVSAYQCALEDPMLVLALIDRLAALEAALEPARTAIALLNSMVLSGESHSDESYAIVQDARAALGQEEASRG